MYKDHLLFSLEREIELLKRLSVVIKENDLDYRPFEKARSTHELMQYVAGVGSMMMRWFTEDLTPEMREKIRDYNKTVTIANFEERLEEQKATIRKVMATITEEDLLTKEVELPWKEKMVLSAAIMNAPVKWLASYRMQLFLYLKMNGHVELGTTQAWVL
ncbi:MAG: hypothetical protein JWP12_3372 [Bacteroidetes bacterium]|nr:hypothetical protein [Bacteroidota bacterium]